MQDSKSATLDLHDLEHELSNSPPEVNDKQHDLDPDDLAHMHRMGKRQEFAVCAPVTSIETRVLTAIPEEFQIHLYHVL